MLPSDRHRVHAGAVSSWTVYILECAGGTLYTGINSDLERRLAAAAVIRTVQERAMRDGGLR